MTIVKVLQKQSVMILGEIEWSPLCGNADRPVVPGVAPCRPGSICVAGRQLLSAPDVGSGVF